VPPAVCPEPICHPVRNRRHGLMPFRAASAAPGLTHSPSKPGRYQRSYSPRTVGGKVMTPADLRRLHKYMLEIQKVSAISDEMGTVVESEWPELAHKLPSKKRR
jgi:hypothetical protein